MLPRGEYQEKRDFSRMGVECRMTYTVDGEGSPVAAVAKNLSATGLLIATDREIALGTLLDVCLTPEQPLVPPLEASVEVVRVEAIDAGRYELGVTIKAMKPSAG